MEVLGSFVLFVFSILATCAAQDTITVDQVIRDGDGETLVSTNEMYELGFFSPGRSRNRFLGIWYKNVSPQTVVWVANRETPITDSSGVFKVDTNGSLLVIAGTNDSVLWSSNTSIVSPTTIIPVAQLLSTGNLVVRGNDDEFFVWQSFDYPTDTFLPGMKYGKDMVSRLDRRFTSWKSVDCPSRSQYVVPDTEGSTDFLKTMFISAFKDGTCWNGVTFQWLANLHSVVTRIYINTEGNFLRLTWNDKIQKWVPYWHADTSICNLYGVCGPYGKCNANNSPICSCMEGFEPRNPAKWNASEWSSGCRRRTPLDCPNGDGFQVVKNIKLPDTRRSWYNRNMTLGECATACERNCACAAYANIEITRGGSGCLTWSGNLMDVRTIDESQDLYVRMAISDLKVVQSTSESSSNKRRRIILASVSIVSSLVVGILFLATLYAWSKKKRSLVKKQDERSRTIEKEYSMEIHHDNTELSYFSLTRISKSTNDFSDDNKVGEGGFGPVYK
ncbi:G-type lectin S-receptor-like serine/threonine-protein kinase, partial [Tanacetum coccineum]